ncbi:MAG TPA: hypothetical protein VGA37_09100 [Gemmatimonadales bacterium]
MPPTAPERFFNPKSMLTPGIAGATIVLIANTLRATFGIPPVYSAFVLSFLFAVVVFQAAGLGLGQRLAYYVLNALVIFSTAVGGNVAGDAALGGARAGRGGMAASLLVTPDLSRLARRDTATSMTALDRAVDSLSPATIRDLLSGVRPVGVELTVDGRRYHATASVAPTPSYVIDPTTDSSTPRQLYDPVQVTLRPVKTRFFGGWFPGSR